MSLIKAVVVQSTPKKSTPLSSSAELASAVEALSINVKSLSDDVARFNGIRERQKLPDPLPIDGTATQTKIVEMLNAMRSILISLNFAK